MWIASRQDPTTGAHTKVRKFESEGMSDVCPPSSPYEIHWTTFELPVTRQQMAGFSYFLVFSYFLTFWLSYNSLTFAWPPARPRRDLDYWVWVPVDLFCNLPSNQPPQPDQYTRVGPHTHSFDNPNSPENNSYLSCCYYSGEQTTLHCSVFRPLWVPVCYHLFLILQFQIFFIF